MGRDGASSSSGLDHVSGGRGPHAHSPDSLHLPLNPLWTHQDTHQPRAAWPTSQRMQFDDVMQVVARGDRVVMGSSVDGSVFALDAASGHVAWRFFTEGPIRFAPAIWRDCVFAASDDGYLYALRLADGGLQWKHRGHPGEASVLGNRRMISKWPMRGGPVVAEGIVYCAAGIWPSDGIRLYALDAKTGAVVWRNADSGSIYMPQPHGGANAKEAQIQGTSNGQAGGVGRSHRRKTVGESERHPWDDVGRELEAPGHLDELPANSVSARLRTRRKDGRFSRGVGRATLGYQS